MEKSTNATSSLAASKFGEVVGQPALRSRAFYVLRSARLVLRGYFATPRGQAGVYEAARHRERVPLNLL